MPEKGPDGNYSLQVDYDNLFACCTVTIGMGKKEAHKRHCGDAKGEKNIRGFIQEHNCTKYFKYNNLGEILPNGVYVSFEEYNKNRGTLPKDQLDALKTLETLNLNSTTLVEERKKEIAALLKVISRLEKKKIDEKIIEFEQETHYHRFIDVLLYYMRQKK